MYFFFFCENNTVIIIIITKRWIYKKLKYICLNLGITLWIQIWSVMTIV